MSLSVEAARTSPNEDFDDKRDIQMVESHVQKEARDLTPLKSSLDTISTFRALSVFRNSLVICGLAAFSSALDGYQNQLSGSIIANAGFIKHFANGAKKLPAAHVSTFGGLFSAGQVIGQAGIPFVSERFGRKIAMYTFCVLLLAATFAEAFGTQWYHWTVAKAIAGIGIGAVQASLPVYIAEHAPAQLRGFLVVSYSFWFNVGGLMASVALKVRKDTHPQDWKTPVLTQFAMIGAAVLIYVFLPESPWWLAGQGRVEEAHGILQKKNGSIPGYDADAEVKIMVATIEQQREWDRIASAEGHFAMLTGLNLKRFIIGAWPKTLQQFVGLSIFSNYSTYFFQLAGNKNPFNVTVILGCVSLLAVVVDATLVDKIGRRRMTLFGFTGACLGVTLMAIIGCFDYKNQQLGSALVFAGVLANFCNTFQSSTSYAYLTECSEQRFRARATGWGLAFCNLWAILFSFTVPLMLAKWVVKTAFLFVGLGIPGTVLAYFIMPETMRRSPAEIHEMFVDEVPLRKWRGYKTQVERELEMQMGERL